MDRKSSTKNLVLGKGVCYFNRFSEAIGAGIGERDLGNAPSVNFNVTAEQLKHMNSRRGLGAVDLTVTTGITPMFNFSLEEITDDNMALGLFSEVEAITQDAEDGVVKVISNVEQGLYYDLDRRHVGVHLLAYKEGTVGFTVGETISGATGEGVVLQVIGDTTSGYLYLEVVTPGFIADENITGDGVTPGDAQAVAAEEFIITAFNVEDANTPGTFFTAGTDFTVDSGTGRIRITEGGGLGGSGTTTIKVTHACTAATWRKVSAFKENAVYGAFRFISENPQGPDYEFLAWKVSITLNGDFGLIGDTWAALPFQAEVLDQSEDHPTEPYMHIIIPD